MKQGERDRKREREIERERDREREKNQLISVIIYFEKRNPFSERAFLPYIN